MQTGTCDKNYFRRKMHSKLSFQNKFKVKSTDVSGISDKNIVVYALRIKVLTTI